MKCCSCAKCGKLFLSDKGFSKHKEECLEKDKELDINDM